MRTLNAHNAHELLETLSDAIKATGTTGLWIEGIDALDAYLAGVLTMDGRVAVVIREGRAAFVWLKRRAPRHRRPVIREERGK